MKLFSGRVSSFARQCRLVGENGEILDEMRAFIIPLRYKNKMYLYGVNTRIGYNPEGYYLYIGPPETDIENAGNALIECGSGTYKTDRAEKVYSGDEIIYIWAIIRKTSEAEEDE